MSTSTPVRSRGSSSDITIITTTRAINTPPHTPPVSSPVTSPSAAANSLPRTLSHHRLPLSSPPLPAASSAQTAGSWWGAVASTVKFLSALALEDDLPTTPQPITPGAPVTPRSQLSAQGRRRPSPPASSGSAASWSPAAPLAASSSLSRGRSQTALPGLPRPVSLHHPPSVTFTPPQHLPSSRSISSPGSPAPTAPQSSAATSAAQAGGAAATASPSRAPHLLHPSPPKHGDKEEEDATPVDALATSPPVVGSVHRRVQSASSSSPFSRGSVSPSFSAMAALPPPATLGFSLAQSSAQLQSFQRLQSIDVVEHIEADELGPQFSPVMLRHRAASTRDEHSNGLLHAVSSSSSSEEKEAAASPPAPTTPAADSPTDVAAASSSSSQPLSSATVSAPSSPPLSASSSTRNLRLSHFHRLLSEETLDIDALRQLSWHGVPAPVRADVWRLLLGYLPLSRARREGMLEKRRAEYVSFLRQHYATLNSAALSSSPATDSEAASASSSSSSAASSVSASSSSPEAEIMSQILQDVPRTCPALPFFKLAAVQKSLERVLFIFSVRHPASGYVQGFNDLVTPFYSVFLSALLPHLPEPVASLSSLPLSESALLGLEADCFPELDTRVLTDAGFLFLSEIEARLDRKERVLYGCYDVDRQAVVYSPGRVVTRAPPARWVDFTQAATRQLWGTPSNDYSSAGAGAGRALKLANHLSIRTTPRHAMYVQLGQRAGSTEKKCELRQSGKAPVPPHKMFAEELAPGFACTCEEDCVECCHGYAAYRLLTGARSGISHADVMSIHDTALDSPVIRLGLRSDDQLNAFLELYGYWLGDGSMRYDSATTGAVRFSPTKLRDRPYLLGLMERLRLKRTEWSASDHNAAGCLTVHITAERWWRYFDEEYGLKYTGSLHYKRSEAVAKWFWWWVLSRLNREQVRLVIDGLRQAGDVTARSKKQEAAGADFIGSRRIRTSSVAFRDALIQACLHAGYSAHFSINTRAGGRRSYHAVPEMEQLKQDDPSRVFRPVAANHDNWIVNYSVSTSALLSAADVRYDGKALQRREKQKSSQGYVALHSDGRHARAATQLELAEVIGMSQTGVELFLRQGFNRTSTGWQILTAADYDERADVTGSAPVSTSASVSGSSSHSAWPSATPSASATTEMADAYSPRDGRTWCVQVEHDDHLIFVQRAHRNAAGIVTKASSPVVTGNCFGCLSFLLSSIQDHYTFAQPGIQRCIYRLSAVVQRVAPQLHAHLESEGVAFLHFAFRWMNCLLMREWSLACSVRLFDTFISLCLASSSSFASFHVYVCAAFLLHFESRLMGMDFTQLLLFLQKPPTEAWTSREVEAIIAQAYVFRSWDEKGEGGGGPLGRISSSSSGINGHER